MADLPTRKDNVTAVPTSDPHELSDEELAKVAGGGGVIEDRTARKVTANVQVDSGGTQMNPGAIAGWGDPH